MVPRNTTTMEQLLNYFTQRKCDYCFPAHTRHQVLRLVSMLPTPMMTITCLEQLTVKILPNSNPNCHIHLHVIVIVSWDHDDINNKIQSCLIKYRYQGIKLECMHLTGWTTS